MTADNEKTPAQLGYRWPAEWEPHRATWLSWPHNRNSWPNHFEPVPEEFATFVRTLARFEPEVHILAGKPDVFAEATRLVGDIANVTIHDIPTNDAWCRDHGPTFLAGEGLPPALVDWEYNAWGGKYAFDLDNLIPGKIAAYRGRKKFTPGIILEGGAIDGNGRGTILTTEMCLLNPNRNANLGREEIERYLRDYLGAKKILWLSGGEVAGDDTDGHIDQLARFVDPTTIVASSCDDPTDDNYEPCQANLEQLRAMTDQDNRPLKIVELLLPPPLYVDEQRLPAGYCNFLIVNGGVIVPQFEVPESDRLALEVLKPLFPGRDVVGSPSRNLIWGLGSFHCLSQQEPQT